MVSVREIRRMFDEVDPSRQLPSEAIEEFKLRSKQLMKEFIVKCSEEAGENNRRLSRNNVRVAYLVMMDRANEIEGEWND